MRITIAESAVILFVLCCFACGETKTDGNKAWVPRGEAQDESLEVVVYTSVDQVFSEPVLRAFEKESGLIVKTVFDTEETKSTGILNRLVAESRNPRADVFWSGDPVRPEVLVKRSIAKPYSPTTAGDIPPEFKAKDGSLMLTTR
jgi:ABC-type thiamine transport system substrate-binding protein